MKIFPIVTTFVTTVISSKNDCGCNVFEKTNEITELYQPGVRQQIILNFRILYNFIW